MKASSPTTSWPSARRCSQRWEPTKPAAPVTRMRIVRSPPHENVVEEDAEPPGARGRLEADLADGRQRGGPERQTGRLEQGRAPVADLGVIGLRREMDVHP